MTRDEILSMEAGKKLDAKIEMEVFGWPRAYDDFNDIPNYSTDISAAWEVVEKMKYNWSFVRDVGKCGSEYETIGNMLYRFIYTAPGMPIEGIVADTAPLAICRAALLAVLDEMTNDIGDTTKEDGG